MNPAFFRDLWKTLTDFLAKPTKKRPFWGVLQGFSSLFTSDAGLPDTHCHMNNRGSPGTDLLKIWPFHLHPDFPDMCNIHNPHHRYSWNRYHNSICYFSFRFSIPHSLRCVIRYHMFSFNFCRFLNIIHYIFVCWIDFYLRISKILSPS